MTQSPHPAGVDNGAMHETMERLYKAAAAIGVRGQSNLAATINESAQTVNNWEARGISARGAIKAARAVGCSPDWLMTGVGDMSVAPPTASSGLSAQAIELATLFDLLPPDKVVRATVYHHASAAILDALQGRKAT